MKYKIVADVDRKDGGIDYWIMVRQWFVWFYVHPYSTRELAEKIINRLEAEEELDK